jgi:hypothetical protein
MAVSPQKSKEWAEFTFANIGKCPKCMRHSFYLATFFIFSTSFSYAFNAKENIFHILLFASIISTTLWLSHIVLYAYRYADHIRNKIKSSNSAKSISNSPTDRRAFVRSFAQALGSVAIATSAAPLIMPSTKKYQKFAGACWDGQCGRGTYCCQYGDDSWCCYNNTQCLYGQRACR